MQTYMCVCICTYTCFLKNPGLIITKLSYWIFETSGYLLANLKNTFMFYFVPCAE